MPTIAQFQLGRHWTSAVVTPVSAAADGTTTDVTASAVTFNGKLNNNKAIRMVTSPLSPVDAVLTNNVKEEDDWELSMSILKYNNTSDPNPLWTIRGSYDVVKLVLVEGTATGSTVTYTFYGLLSEVVDGIEGKGGQIASFTLLPVGIAPTRVVA